MPTQKKKAIWLCQIEAVAENPDISISINKDTACLHTQSYICTKIQSIRLLSSSDQNYLWILALTSLDYKLFQSLMIL